jgi:hypothetical protein
MFLPAKKSHKISIPSEIEQLKEVVEGPFLKAKRKICVDSEFEFLLKKFEKKLQQISEAQVSEDSENHFDYCENSKAVKQVKLVKVFNVQKPFNTKP